MTSADAIFGTYNVWAFASLNASPGARAHYDRRRDAGDRHSSAQRNLFNRQCHEVNAAASKSSPVRRWIVPRFQAAVP
ncbi:hypothetical protein EAO69_34545 [Streptomyces sp. me109]|nr:hypothetical protein EAO69_34545 [Streptomyces sp. me109]